MDKNTVTGFVLIAVVLIAFSWWSRPTEEQRAEALRRDSLEMVAKASAAKETVSKVELGQNLDTASFVGQVAKNNSEQKLVKLSNDKVDLYVNTFGGFVEKAVVKGFESIDGKDAVTLFEKGDQKLNFILPAKESNINISLLHYLPSEITDTTVTLVAAAKDGRSIVVKHRLGDDYLLHTGIKVDGMSGMFAPNVNSMAVDWEGRCRQQEKGFNFESRYATLTYHNEDGGTDYLSETSEVVDEVVEDKTDWVAFKTQFFSAVMIAKDGFKENAVFSSIPQQKETHYLKHYHAKMDASFDPTGKKATEFEFYYGPNDYRLLKTVQEGSSFGKDLEMEKLVYLGWPIVREINRWFTIYVFDWLTALDINMGVVLIIITLLLKLITYPLVKKSYMGSAKMRVLKPKLDAATAQFNGPDSQMQKQQAMMAEYAKYGVSPLSGCLPVLIQMPIWVAMFNFVPNAIQLRGESFLWISDLSTYDPIVEWGTNIWMIGDHLSLTCILFCVANVLYTMMTMRQQKDQMVGQQAEQMKMMQWMMYIMPLMFFFMFNDYSAGLNFYYFISLFFSAAIMWVLRKTTNDKKLLAYLEARYNENKNNPKKMGGLAARLQALQEQQEQLKKRAGK